MNSASGSILGASGQPRPTAFDINRVRGTFPYLAQCAYLNTASVGLSWVGEGRAAAEFYEAKAQGTGAIAEWSAKAEATKHELASLLLVPAAALEFVGSTTEALNLIALGLPLKRGQQIVLAEDEFPSVMLPWMSLLERGIEIKRVRITRESQRTELLCDAVDSKTRVVAVSHVHWRTGTRVDLAQLKAACALRDCRLIVDGVQAIGAVPVDASGVDAYCASVFKWLLSGFGLGFVAVSDQLAAELQPALRGYSNTFPSRSIRYGHVNYPGIFALHATLGYLNGLGWNNIHQRVDVLAKRTIARLHDRGFEVLTPERAHGGIVSIRHPRAAAVVRSLAEQSIVVEDGAPIVRASTHFYNTEEEIERFVQNLSPPHE